jgi:hypothetical protein
MESDREHEVPSLNGPRWAKLALRDEASLRQAEVDADNIARAVAVIMMVNERDAVIEEFSDRVDAVKAAIWPSDPLEGYGLHASFGAFLVTRFAMTTVGAAQTGLRHEPMAPSALVNALVGQRVPRAQVLATIGDFSGASSDFEARKQGLDASRIAGLAERSLTLRERNEALSQVVFSPRCLARLASSMRLIHAVRRLLPVLPPVELGDRLVAAMAALVLHEPERAIELAGDEESLGLSVVRELAEAIRALEAGVGPSFSGVLPGPETASPDPDSLLADAASSSSNDTDDLFNQEGESDEEAEGVRVRDFIPRSPRWGETEPSVSEGWFMAFQRGYWGQANADLHHSSLGLRSPRSHFIWPPIPPDDRVLEQVVQELEEEPREVEESFEPLQVLADPSVWRDAVNLRPIFSTTQKALRAVLNAAEGNVPTSASVETSGDLAWVVRRMRAIALASQGYLLGAQEAVRAFADRDRAAPEYRWAKERWLMLGRPEGRADPIPHEACRQAASKLVYDLAEQTARTVARDRRLFADS